MQKIDKIFVVFLTIFATSAPCFCWVQMVSILGCHDAATEMENCCCSIKAAVYFKTPAHDLAVLPVEWKGSQLDTALLPVSVVSFLSYPPYLSFKRHDCEGFFRSLPDLYLLHATFLI